MRSLAYAPAVTADHSEPADDRMSQTRECFRLPHQLLPAQPAVFGLQREDAARHSQAGDAVAAQATRWRALVEDHLHRSSIEMGLLM